MAVKKSWSLKRLLLTLIFLVLLAMVFVLLDGGNLLRDAGHWIGGLGGKADTMKGKIEKGAQSVEKKAGEVKEAVTSVEKKAEKVKNAVTSEDRK